MRVSSRLILNAVANYSRLGITFLLGIFFTWFVVGKIGMVGLGALGLVAATFGMSAAVESALRQSLIRELAAAIASGEEDHVKKSMTAAMLFCAPAAVVAMLISIVLSALAYWGVFNTKGAEHLNQAIAVLLLAEGVHMIFRLLASPYTQAIFASQRLGLDNILRVVDRLMWVLSAVLVFGFWMEGRPLYIQLIGFALTRATIQNADALFGFIFAKIFIPGMKLDFRNIDWHEFRTMMKTIWHTGQVTLLMNLNEQVLAIIINLFFGLTFNGIWQIVVQVGGQARQLTEGLMRGIEPLSTSLHHKGEKDAILKLMTRTIRYQLMISLPMVTTYLVFLLPILNLWVKGRLSAFVKEQIASGNNFILNTFGVNSINDAVSAAILLAAIMSSTQLIAMAVRVSVRGVERILYGIGYVDSYAWFAKYAAIIIVSCAVIFFSFSSTPVLAPVATLISYIIFYQMVIPRAARNRTGFSPIRAWRKSLPRPLIANLILTAFLLPLRMKLDTLNIKTLFALVAGVGVFYSFLTYFIILLPDEKQRVKQLFRRLAKKSVA